MASAPSANAGLLRTDFSAPLPAGVAASGSAAVDGGVLKLTNAGAAQGGDFRVDDLDGDSPVKRMTVSFRMLIGGGTSGPGTSVLSGDGLSFSFASDLPASPGSLGEEGAGSGLRVSFDTFDGDGAGAADAIAIDVFFNGALKGRREFQSSQGTAGSDFYDVVIDLRGDGTLDLFFGQYQPNVDAPVPVFSGLETEYTPSGGWTFALAARTGNLNDNHWIDDLTISTKVPEPGTLALLVLALGCAAVARSRR
jgi:hypothetical protein